MKDDPSELFTQVDNVDMVIGSVTRKLAHSDKNIIHRSVGIFVINQHNQMLFQQRSMLKDKDPGYWTISVGGHVTFNDDYETSAHREILEELGISPKIMFITKSIMYMPTETEFTAFFNATIDKDNFKIATDEISSITWVSLKEISNFIASHTVTEWGVDSLKLTGYL